MGRIYKADNMEDAINLANQFKREGKYDLFRGQAQNWPVRSSAGRLANSAFRKSQEILERLYYFFDTNSPLHKFNKDASWFYAVAQHYGLPTNFIDFSKSQEVAFFFATNSRHNLANRECAIVCLNKTEFTRFIQFTAVIYENDKVNPPSIIEIDVDNLWRLQAQQGCFLYTPYDEIEFYYDFDRITFPFSNSYKEISEDEIYPKRKSELEIYLDQFFNSEQRIAGTKRLEKFAAETNALTTWLPPLSFDGLLKKQATHPTWESANSDKWNYQLVEPWDAIKNSYKLNLQFDSKKALKSQLDCIVKELEFHFNEKGIDKESLIEFDVVAKPKLSKKLSKIINDSCKRIWDGTRGLPYTMDEIFMIIAKYICLEFYDSEADDTLSLSGEELVVLELTNEYGSVTRCYASPSKIINCFREDVKDILCDELTQDINSEILLRINQANLLFDFTKLTELFKDELIPYQVLYNSEKNNPVIYYSPAQISVLGYA